MTKRIKLNAYTSLPCRGCTTSCPNYGVCENKPWRMTNTTPRDAVELTLFYDGSCPLCVKEINTLASLDENKQIKLVDIQTTPLCIEYPMIDHDEATTILHGMLPDGKIILGLDVTARAWSIVGKHSWIQLLRLPVIRTISDVAYLFFARNRYSISWLLTGRSRCNTCTIESNKS